MESLRRARGLVGRWWPVALLMMVVLGGLAWLGAAVLTAFIQRLAGSSATSTLVAAAVAAALAAVIFGPLPQVGLTLLYDRLRTQKTF